MITITRRQVRTLRGLFRRSTLGITHRGPLPPLLLSAAESQIHVRYCTADLAVERTLPAVPSSTGSAALPLDALADLEGRDDTILAFDPVAADRTVVRWAERGIPQTREFRIPARPQPRAFPDRPEAWAEVPGSFLDALVAATATTTTGSTRYALDCILLRAADGAVIATDGHQALVHGGFGLPGASDILVAGSPLFSSRDLPRDRPWALGQTATDLVLRGESTTIALAIRTGVRFPCIADIFPEPTAATARLRLDRADATNLAEALHRLPGGDQPLTPVTVDLNGHVAVRARGNTDAAATELVLARSSYQGVPTRFGTDRTLLNRALRLGFTELEVGEPAAPLVCRSGELAYAWQPLSVDAIIPAEAVATRIESPAGAPVGTGRPAAAPAGAPAEEIISPPTPPNATVVSTSRQVGTDVVAVGLTPTRPSSTPLPRTATTDEPEATGLAALLGEAEALHEALASARDRTRRLILALKHHRKQARLMASTLRSLRQLGLQEVTG